MSDLKKAFFGYDKDAVEQEIAQLNQQLIEKDEKILEIKQELFKVQEEHLSLVRKSVIAEKANEEIARLALKEASDLITKAKKNANLILKESMEYVRGLNSEVDTFKNEALAFREEVVKMSNDLIESIDKSEIFSLINEEENTEKETDY